MATEHAVANEKAAPNGKDKKVTLTISTLSGDYTHDFPGQQKLQVVIDQTIEKLKLTGEDPGSSSTTASSSPLQRRSRPRA